MKTRNASLLLGLGLLVCAEIAEASTSFQVVGDTLLDITTGYGWREVSRTGMPSTLSVDDSWSYASLSEINAMLPDPGSYDASSDVARAVAFLDPGKRGYIEGWLTHGSNVLGLPVFDASFYFYTLGTGGRIEYTGWGLATVGDYSALNCTPPFSDAAFEAFCATSHQFFIVNTTFQSTLPLPTSWPLLAGGLVSGLMFRRRSVRQLGGGAMTGSQTPRAASRLGDQAS